MIMRKKARFPDRKYLNIRESKRERDRGREMRYETSMDAHAGWCARARWKKPVEVQYLNPDYPKDKFGGLGVSDRIPSRYNY